MFFFPILKQPGCDQLVVVVAQYIHAHTLYFQLPRSIRIALVASKFGKQPHTSLFLYFPLNAAASSDGALCDAMLVTAEILWITQLTICAGVDEHLRHFNWKRKITKDYPKPWMQHARAYVELVLRHFVSFEPNLVEMKFATQNLISQEILKNLKRPETPELNDPLDTNTGQFGSIETALVFEISVQNPKYYGTSPVITQLPCTWYLFLHPQLRSAVMLQKVVVHGHANLCDYNFHIVPNQNETFLFCGIYSNVTLYPPTRDTKLVLLYGPLDSFELLVLIDTMSSSTAATSRFIHLFDHKNVYLQHFVRISIIEWEVRSTHLVSEKYKRISVRFSGRRDNVTAYLFDGPGFLSEKTTIQPTDHALSCSSFQCVVQIVKHEYDSMAMRTYSRSSLVRKGKRCTFGSKSKAQRFSDHLENHSFFIKLYCNGQKANHLKLSFTEFQINGISHAECLTGGVSLFSFTKWNKFVHLDTLCGSRLPLNRTFFSESNSLVLFLFNYMRYTTLSVKFTIVPSVCRLFRINVCSMFHEKISEFFRNAYEFQDQLDIMSLDHVMGQKDRGFRATTINATGSTCSVAQFFVAMSKCGPYHTQIPTDFNKRFFSFFFPLNVDVSLNSDEPRMYEFLLTGHLVSKAAMLAKEKENVDQMDTRLLVGGREFEFDRGHDVTITDLNNNRLSGENISNIYKDETPWPKPLGSSEKLRISLHVEQLYKRSWTLRLKLRSMSPLHQQSIYFGLVFYGVDSWIDICIKPAEQSRRHRAFCVTNKPTRFHMFSPSHPFTLSVSRNYHKLEDVKLSLNITTEVGRDVTTPQ